MPGHEPLLSQLVPGVITIRRNKSDSDYHLEHYATYGGVLEISKSGVRVLVDRLWPRGLSRERARIDLWLKEIAPSDTLRRLFHV